MLQNKQLRHQHIIYLYSLLIIAVTLRIIGLSNTSLRGDEVVSRYYAQLPLAQLMDVLRSYGVHPPLFYLLFRQWLLAAGESILAFRYIPFFASILYAPPPALLGDNPKPQAILGDRIELLGWIVRNIPVDGQVGEEQPISLGVPNRLAPTTCWK